MKTKQERRDLFRDTLITAMDKAQHPIEGETMSDNIAHLHRLFDAECQAAADAMTSERDKINVALTVIDATDWVQFPQSLQKVTTDVLESYLKDDKET